MRIAMICAETARAVLFGAAEQDAIGAPEQLLGFFRPEVEYGYRGQPLDELIEAANKYNPDILVAPEFFFYDGEPYTEREKDNAVKCIQGMVRKKDMLILPGTFVWQKNGYMHNSCPVIAGGIAAAEYFKAEDGGDSDIALRHGLGFAAGSENGKVIRWKGLGIGLEICADHEARRLRRSGKEVDLHIVVSAGKCLNPNAVASRDSGYAAACNGVELCDIAAVKGKMLEYIPGKLEGNVKIYEIEL